MLTDANLLFEHIHQLCQSPRPAMSDELETARRYVTSTLESSGWNITREPFQAHNEMLEALSGINLVATHPELTLAGKGDNFPTLIVGAHLDSRPNTPGADDNASAVAALLEIARALPAL